MSHFTVLVIGGEPENQLAPFQENNMGDYPKEFLKYRVDGEYYESEQAATSAGHSEKEVKEGYWENPNRKWDWYSLGGRWAGFFKLKSNQVGIQGHHRAKDFARISGEVVEDLPETVADQCLKGQIDFDAMRNEAGADAQNKYELAMTILEDLPENETWKSIGERLSYSKEAREIYHGQQRVMAWAAAQQKYGKDWPFGWMSSCDEFLVSKNDYIENARNSAVSTFAVIKDGKWYEKGEMGWWGMVSNEKDESQWAKQFSELIDSLPEDTLLSVYDCHI